MNKYTAAGLDVARSAKKLIKKYHEGLSKARVRIDFLFVTTDGEDGCALKCNGYPAAAVASIVPQKYRVATGRKGSGAADARVIIDKDAWTELTDKQKDALLDHEIQHFEVVMEAESGTIALDGNDRPKLRLRKHDVSIGWFTVVAQRHGEHSGEVMQARAMIENTATIFLPGFEFTAKQTPGQKAKAAKASKAKTKEKAAKPLELTQGQPDNVIDIAPATKTKEKAAAK